MNYGKRAVLNPSFRQRTAYHAMLLGGMATLTSAILVIAEKQTRDDIELRRQEDMQQSLSQVIAPDLYSNNLLEDVKHLTVENRDKIFYRAKYGPEVVAVAFEMTGQGYAGPINIIMAVNNNGELMGVRVLSHSETPGLGDKIEPRKDDWIYHFDGLSFNKLPVKQWAVKKDGGDFDQFTGATITPRAVVNTVSKGLSLYNQYRDQLLSDITPIKKPEEKPLSTKASGKTESEPKPGFNDNIQTQS